MRQAKETTSFSGPRYRLHIAFDSVGRCEHNKDWPAISNSLEFDNDGNDIRSKWGHCGAATEAILSTYHFRIVAISTICDDYFAEKITQTLLAGVIPIYLGMPNSHDWDPGLAAGVHQAMIHVQDFEGLEALALFLTELGADTATARERRLRYFEFARAPPAVYPRHAAALLNRTENLTMKEWICQRTHDGDHLRVAKAQSPCRGAWFEYFEELGKDLRKWGCASASTCVLVQGASWISDPMNNPAVLRVLKAAIFVVVGMVLMVAGQACCSILRRRELVLCCRRPATP